MGILTCFSSEISVFESFTFYAELVGFQTMVILDPYGMTFDAVGVWSGLLTFI